MVGRCIVLFGVAVRAGAPHHGLFGDVHQVLEAVVLVLLESREEHVHHNLSLRPHHLPFGLLLLLKLHLEMTRHVSRNSDSVDDYLQLNKLLL